MDSTTLAWYDARGEDIAARYETVESPVAALFDAAFRPASSILDIGCGSGRDLAALLAAGYDAWGLEPSATIRAEAERYHPELQGRITDGGLPATGLPVGRVFDGLLCSAAFMHVPAGDWMDASAALACLVRTGGRLLISIPAARQGLDAQHRDLAGRLFSPLSLTTLTGLLDGAGFGTIGLERETGFGPEVAHRRPELLRWRVDHQPTLKPGTLKPHTWRSGQHPSGAWTRRSLGTIALER